MRALLLERLAGPMRVLSSLAPPEAEPVEDDAPGRAAWRERHADRHGSIEILLALSGRTPATLNGRCYALEAGDWLVIAGGDEHENGYPPDAGPARHVWVRFGGGVVTWQGYAIGGGSHAPDGPMYDLGDIPFAEGFRREIDYLKTATAPPEMRLRHLRGALACLAARMWARTRESPGLEGTARRERAVRLAQRWIEETRGVGLSVDAVARYAGYSPYHFMRLFKRATGVTVKECLENAQYAHCSRRLAEGAAKKLVAAELGFSSPAAFSHWLRRKR